MNHVPEQSPGRKNQNPAPNNENKTHVGAQDHRACDRIGEANK